jgi:hypothetical protein
VRKIRTQVRVRRSGNVGSKHFQTFFSEQIFTKLNKFDTKFLANYQVKFVSC